MLLDSLAVVLLIIFVLLGATRGALAAGLSLVSLVVGTVPVFGNLAYPLQLVASGRGEKDILAQFILYDGFAAAGQALPIWGGKDTLTEHIVNRLPDRLIPRHGKPAGR